MNDIVSGTVKKIISSLDSGMKAPETIPIICNGCRELRMGSALCTLHRYDYPDLNTVVPIEKTCYLCLRWPKTPNQTESNSSLGSRFNALKTLETISNMLILKLTFTDFIPEIGAQLCLIAENQDQDSLQNIAGFPGRIIQVQGRAKIVSRPEFNSSKTTGTFLLKIRKHNKKITSVLSIKNQKVDNFKNELEKKGFLIIKTESIDKKGFDNQIVEKNLNQVAKIALLDSGSIGFESITYLFVENITDLIEIFE